MNETIHPGSKSDVPWPTSASRLQAPGTSTLAGTSTLPGSEKDTQPAVGLLRQAVQGAHDTLDRFADSVEPAVRQMGDTVADAEVALHATASRLRDTGDEWTQGVRTTVRRSPLVSIAAAFALGALFSRITR